MGLAAKFPGVRMPNLGLSEIDAGDLISYIETQTSHIADGAEDPAMAEHHHH